MAVKVLWKRIADGELQVTAEGLEACKKIIEEAEEARQYRGQWSRVMPAPAEGLTIFTPGNGGRLFWRLSAQIWVERTSHFLADYLGKKSTIGAYPDISLLEAMSVRDACCREYAAKIGYGTGISDKEMRQRSLELYQSTRPKLPDPAKLFMRPSPALPKTPEKEPEKEAPEPPKAETAKETQKPARSDPGPIPGDFWASFDALEPTLRRMNPDVAKSILKTLIEATDDRKNTGDPAGH